MSWGPGQQFWFWACMALMGPVWVAVFYILIVEPLFGYWLHPDDWSRTDPRKWLQVQWWGWRNKRRQRR